MMESESRASSTAAAAAGGQEAGWDQAADRGQDEDKQRDGAVSPEADTAPVVGAEVVCSGEGSRKAALRRRPKRKLNFRQVWFGPVNPAAIFGSFRSVLLFFVRSSFCLALTRFSPDSINV